MSGNHAHFSDVNNKSTHKKPECEPSPAISKKTTVTTTTFKKESFLIKELDKEVIEGVDVENVQKNCVISDLEVYENKEVKLTEKTGSILVEKEYLITASGYEKGLRKKKDGLVFFGYDDPNNKEISQNIDIKLNIKKKVSNPTFLFYFRRDNQQYYIKTFDKQNAFIFVNLTFPVKIRSIMIISVGNFNIKFTVDNNSNDLTVNYELEGGKIETK